MHVGDTIFIFCLALIIFGPKKLPEIGRQIGKLMVEFRRASNEFKMQIEEELRASEESERQKEITAATAVLPSATSASDALAATAWGNEAALSATPPMTPTIAPPATGVPVNHTLSSTETSSETATSTAETASLSEDAYPDPGSGFNPGLNTASNGLAAETSIATPDSTVEAASFGPEPEELPDKELEMGKAQTAAHHA